MAEIEITLPTVQYGNVKVTATPEELGLSVAHPGQMGSAVAVYLNLFQQGFKEGAAMDVVYSPEELPDQRLAAKQYQDTVKAAESVIGSDAPGDVQAAAYALLDEELGATELHEHPEDTDPDESAYPNEDITPPWEKDSTVEAKPKPWEGGGSKPAKVAAIDW